MNHQYLVHGVKFFLSKNTHSNEPSNDVLISFLMTSYKEAFVDMQCIHTSKAPSS